MPAICLYFKVHQPYRLRKYRQEEITISNCYEDAAADKTNIDRVADECYLPANHLIYKNILAHSGKFKVSFSISGTVLELLMKYRPDVIRSFKQLAATGHVEFLAETYYHSLSSLHSPGEFQRQVQQHHRLIERLFDITPSVFRNTELIHNNRIAQHVADMGYTGILCEGVTGILRGRSPNHIYKLPGTEQMKILLRNPGLSDDIAFRFDDVHWNEYPLTAGKFADWLYSHPGQSEVINLFMDYETFGIHKKQSSGIFDFLDSLPGAVLKKDGLSFCIPSMLSADLSSAGEYDVPQTISWEDRSGDSCVWCENVMQNNTLKKIYSIETMVRHSRSQNSTDVWGRLQSADHFYYMSEKNDKKEAAKYMNPFATPREAFQNYTNLVTDFEITLIRSEVDKYKVVPLKPSTTNTFF